MNTKDRIDVIRKLAHEIQAVGHDGKQPSNAETKLALALTAACQAYEAEAKPHDTRSDAEKMRDAQNRDRMEKITPKQEPPDVKGWT